MALTVGIKGDFTPQEVSEIIREALVYNERIAKYKIKKYSDICENFEKKYEMDSDLLWKNSIQGNLGMNKTFLTGMLQKEGWRSE